VQVENFTWDDTETDVTKVALSFYSGTDLPPLPFAHLVQRMSMLYHLLLFLAIAIN
jgi:hypothetical protein